MARQTAACSILTQMQSPRPMLDTCTSSKRTKLTFHMFCTILFNSIYINMHTTSNDDKYSICAAVQRTLWPVEHTNVTAPEEANMTKVQ